MIFHKMHGIGNSFIITDNRERAITDPEKVSIRVCDIHKGIGADGLILVENSDIHDIKMRIYNNDGSEAEMCGNGIRCFVKYLHDTGITSDIQMDVETIAGKVSTELLENNGSKGMVKVNMGFPAFKSKDFNGDSSVIIDSQEYNFVSMGNPHAVRFISDYNFDYQDVGRSIENNKDIFPNRTNVEFIRIDAHNEITMRVWERGCGETYACGTGACASVVAGINLNKLDREKILVHLLGGDLEIAWKEDGVIMSGAAENVCSGDFI